MVKEIISDLLSAPIDIATHGANCQCTMGSGIAKYIREHYPEVYEVDLETKKGDYRKLGTLSKCVIENPVIRLNSRLKIIYNSYTQFYYGRDKRHLNYEAIYSCFEKLKEELRGTDYTLGINYKIGCSLAGGNWRIVKTMIEEVFNELPNEVLICKIPE